MTFVATSSVEDLLDWGDSPTQVRAVSGILFVGVRGSVAEVLLLPGDVRLEALEDPLEYAASVGDRVITLEPADAIEDAVERQVPGVLVGGDGRLTFFSPAVVRGVLRSVGGRLVMHVQTGTVCERSVYRLWDFDLSNLPRR